MNPPRCDDLDYIHFLIAAQKVFTCTEAAREGERTDAFTRLLQRQPSGRRRVDMGKGLDDWTSPMPRRWIW